MCKTLLVPFAVASLAACGSSTNPSVSGVFPAEGFAGRTLRVEVSGDATGWGSDATVSFGTGVTVANVEVASPTDLFADITIDPTAALGPVDVTVTGGGTFTLKQAFEIASPVALTFQGDVASLGAPSFTINDLDFDNQFDATTDDQGNYVNLNITGPAGTLFLVSNVAPFQVTGTAFIDLSAATGAVTIESGAGTPVMSPGGTMTVVSRTPGAYTNPATGTFADVGSSTPYTLSATAPALAHFTASSSSPDPSPTVMLVDSSGSFSSGFLGYGESVVQASGTIYMVVVNQGTGGGPFTVSGAAEALAVSMESETNDTGTNANLLSGVPFQVTATLPSSDGGDWYKFVAPTGSTGKVLHFTTNSGTDPYTDTQVEVFSDANGNTSLTGGPVDGSDCFLGCSDYGENFTSDPLTAGDTFWIQVTEGMNYAGTDSAYILVGWIEDAQ